MTPEIETLLAQYINLLNQYGPQSTAARQFIERHRQNEPLMTLIETARQVQGLFAENYLTDSAEPSRHSR